VSAPCQEVTGAPLERCHGNNVNLDWWSPARSRKENGLTFVNGRIAPLTQETKEENWDNEINFP
jgi:hypothetical protein